MLVRITDLKDMADVHFDAGALGRLKAAAFTGAFERWLPAAAAADGQSFVRALLLSQCRRADGDDALEPSEIETLSDDNLDAAADAFFGATGGYFRPRHVETGRGRRARVRNRTEAEAYDASKADGEGGADRLRRVLKDFCRDRSLYHQKIQQRLLGSVDPLAGLLAPTATGSLSRALEGIDAHSRHVGRDRLTTLAGGAVATDALWRGRPLGTDGLYASVLGALPDRSIGRLLTSPARELERALGLSGSNPDGSRTVGLNGFDVFARHQNLGLDFGVGRAAADAAMVAATGRSALDPFAGYLSATDQLVRAYESVLSDQRGFARLLDRRFDLKIAEPLSAVLRNAQMVGDTLAGRSIFPAGYQLAGAAGLLEPSLSGVTADLLRRYGDFPETAPVFAATMATVTAADTEALDEHVAAEQLQKLADLIAQRLPREPHPVIRKGLLDALSLGLTVFAAIVSWQTLQVAREGATSLDIQRLQATIENHGAEAGRRERERAQEDRRLRYAVRRTVVRSEPRREADSIRLVYPDTMLSVIGEQGDWLQVEAMDYQGDAVATGWVLRSAVRLRPPD